MTSGVLDDRDHALMLQLRNGQAKIPEIDVIVYNSTSPIEASPPSFGVCAFLGFV
jgi:hypothetical protein